MEDERLDSIIGKYREAALERDRRDNEAEQKRLEAEQARSRLRAKWKALSELIVSEVNAMNESLHQIGYGLFHGTSEASTTAVGNIIVAFQPVRPDNRGGFCKLEFFAMQDGRVRTGFGTMKEASVSNEFAPIDEFDRSRVQKTILDFLDANAPNYGT